MNNVEDRQSYILDHPLRVEPVPAEQITDEQQAAVADLWSVIGIPSAAIPLIKVDF